jgi:hypothetical protein
MSRLAARVRSPVEREGNEHYIRLILVSFALTVSLTRLFLKPPATRSWAAARCTSPTCCGAACC